MAKKDNSHTESTILFILLGIGITIAGFYLVLFLTR